ncbi:MAG: PAS domain-containing sensor histidine kinase [Desulfobacterium sp.]|nr:PAS domain-containing sensor histidine kinase [Desulfobacterium sp.]
MKNNILMINFDKASIPNLERSKFYPWIDFKALDRADELLLSANEILPDFIVIFIDPEKENPFQLISGLKKVLVETEIIAAINAKDAQLGVKTLKSGASDFMVLPADAATVDFYIARALERNYLHKHLCFSENCYKSRFASSQENYQQLFDEVPCFVYVQDQDYHIVESNKKFNAYFGEHIGEYCFGICKNRDDPCRVCPVDKTFKDGKNHASETEIISSFGVKHTVLHWTAPIKDGFGNVTKVLVMLTDITEVRRLEDHLTSLGFMIGSISHGVKGLLTGLDSGIYTMGSGIKNNNPERIKEGFEVSSQMTARIKKLVLDILYYTKTRKLNWQKVPATDFLNDTLELVSQKARKKNINIKSTIRLDKGDDLFEIDRTSLQAALVNILENGLEACAADTTRPDHTLLLNAKADSETITLLIQDTGKGMNKTTLSNIFTIFFSSKGTQGTGLGLYIANKVIEQHRGEITVRSKPGRGTRFLITIPRQVPEVTKKNRGSSPN